MVRIRTIGLANISENAEEIELQIGGIRENGAVIRTLSKELDYEETYRGILPDKITIAGYSFITIEFGTFSFSA